MSCFILKTYKEEKRIAKINGIPIINFYASMLEEIFNHISEQMFLICQYISELPSNTCMLIFKLRYKNSH